MSFLYSVILAGGKGTRMKSKIPKVLFKIGDKTLIEYCLENIQQVKPYKIIIVVGYQRQQVMDLLGNKVEYAIQEEQLGTGHALVQTKKYFKDDEDGYVLVSNGDMPFISSKIFQELSQSCQKNQASAAMLSVKTKDYDSWGRVIRNDQSEVKKIVEAKDANQDELAIEEKNAGIYCFKIKDLFNALYKINANNAQEEYYLTDVIEILGKAGKKVISIITDNYQEIIGINTPTELKIARKLIKYGKYKN